jgi:hypothetical protein
MAAAPDENTMRQRRLLRQALPHLITMIVTLGVGWLWWGQTRTVVVQMPAATAVVAPAAVTVVAAMTATPVPAVVAEISRQELLDVKAETQALWSAVYLSRALLHVADAELALQSNDMTRAEQVLLLLDDALQQAAAYATGVLRDPIEQLRRDVIGIRQDLYARPDGIDGRLVRLRQSLLTLIGEPTRFN